MSLPDSSSPSKGFQMTFEPNVDADTTYTLSVVLQCNADITNPLDTTFTVTKFDTTAAAGLAVTSGNMNIQVTGTSAYGRFPKQKTIDHNIFYRMSCSLVWRTIFSFDFRKDPHYNYYCSYRPCFRFNRH